MDLIEGLQEAFRRDAMALRDSIQAERQWCLDAFITIRPQFVAAFEDAKQALLDAPLPSRHSEAQFQDAVNALWFCDSRINGLREGMTDMAARETGEK